MSTLSKNAVRDILSNPALKIHAVGPRSMSARAATFLIKAVYKASLFAMIGSLGTWALSPTGLPQEVAARVVDASPIASAPEHVHWIEGATSPFLEVGRREDGSISIDDMLSEWERAGVPPWEVPRIMEKVEQLSPVLMGRVDPQLESDFMSDAASAAVWLDKTYPEISRRLAAGEPFQRSPEAQEHFDNAWLRMREPLLGEIDRAAGPPPPTWVSNARERKGHLIGMREALASLAHAVQVTGIRSLRLPLAYWSSPLELNRAAKALETANAELAQATGWKGQVLGLGGRVELALGSPNPVHRALGLTLGDTSGRLQVTTQWQSLGHEWFHALDLTLGRMVFYASTGSALSLETGPLRLVSENRQVWTAMRLAQAQVFEVAPTWQAVRESAAKALDNAFWTDTREGLAFAFAAQLQRSGAKVLSTPSDEFELTRLREPQRFPNAAEGRAQTRFFRGLFAAAAPLGLSDTSKAPTMNQWNQHRNHGRSQAQGNAEYRMPTLR